MKKFLAVVCLTVVVSAALWCDDLPIQTSLYVWGLSGAVGFRPVALVEGQETTFWAGAGALWSWADYWRYPSGTPVASSDEDPNQALVTMPAANWKLGVEQGFVRQPGAPAGQSWENNSLLRAVLYYRGTAEEIAASGSYLADSTLPDKNGLVQNSFLGGLIYDALTKVSTHGIKRGFYAEATGETAPRVIQSVSVDFTRANVTAMGFWPIFDLDPTSRANVLSLLAADYVAVDQLWGSQIPFMVAQGMGGLQGIDYYGAGNNLVRGVETGRFDGNFKAMNSLELRFNLPAFPDVGKLAPDLPPAFPGLVAYFDSGYYSQVSGLTSGFLFSTGFGFFVCVPNLGSLGLAKDFWINGTDFNLPPFRIIFGMQF